MTTKQSTWEDIQPSEVKDILKDNNIQFIDVREDEEYTRGHIPGIKNIPLSEIHVRANEIDPEKEVVLVCRSGNRSAKACEYITSLGYKKVKNMVGGMNEWTGEVE